MSNFICPESKERVPEDLPETYGKQRAHIAPKGRMDEEPRRYPWPAGEWVDEDYDEENEAFNYG